ncbi:hypothetical protein Pelo_3228 [Pelomyxa schiedti]|nr:hypothetical protein Pelo_3228 [Pelomyxa schiedti]
MAEMAREGFWTGNFAIRFQKSPGVFSREYYGGITAERLQQIVNTFGEVHSDADKLRRFNELCTQRWFVTGFTKEQCSKALFREKKGSFLVMLSGEAAGPRVALRLYTLWKNDGKFKSEKRIFARRFPHHKLPTLYTHLFFPATLNSEPVVIKRISKTKYTTKQLLYEARLMTAICHQNVIPLIGVREDREEVQFVMPLMERTMCPPNLQDKIIDLLDAKKEMDFDFGQFAQLCIVAWVLFDTHLCWYTAQDYGTMAIKSIIDIDGNLVHGIRYVLPVEGIRVELTMCFIAGLRTSYSLKIQKDKLLRKTRPKE